jgi:hypothetical protein
VTDEDYYERRARKAHENLVVLSVIVLGISFVIILWEIFKMIG